MYMSRGQKLALMSKVNSMGEDFVTDWVDKTCAMVRTLVVVLDFSQNFVFCYFFIKQKVCCSDIQ